MSTTPTANPFSTRHVGDGDFEVYDTRDGRVLAVCLPSFQAEAEADRLWQVELNACPCCEMCGEPATLKGEQWVCEGCSPVIDELVRQGNEDECPGLAEELAAADEPEASPLQRWREQGDAEMARIAALNLPAPFEPTDEELITAAGGLRACPFFVRHWMDDIELIDRRTGRSIDGCDRADARAHTMSAEPRRLWLAELRAA